MVSGIGLFCRGINRASEPLDFFFRRRAAIADLADSLLGPFEFNDQRIYFGRLKREIGDGGTDTRGEIGQANFTAEQLAQVY